MSSLLQLAFEKAKTLPAEEQDSLARRWLAELADNELWDTAFEDSQDELARLAEEALAEHRAGKTVPLDPDKL